MRSDLQIIPVDHGKTKVFVVQDHLGLIPQGLVLNGEAIAVLITLNRVKTASEFQYQMMRMNNGLFISESEIRRIIDRFDENFLLDTIKFRDSKRDLINAYSSLDVRSPVLSGTGYPSDREILEKFIDEILAMAYGQEKPEGGGTVKAIVSPHIDINIGRRVYGKAYFCWPEKQPQRILLLGTGHTLENGFFSMTTKHYDTPLGLLKTDVETVLRLKKSVSGAAAPDDFAHRSEHSLELQSIFIRRLIGNADVGCIPVLCGSFTEFLGLVNRPHDYLQVTGFMESLSEIARDPGTMIVAGVDLSHIGPKFGHDRPATSLRKEAARHDQLLLEALAGGDILSFWAESNRVKDRYNVCGLSTLATLLEIAGPLRGRILDYEMWDESSTRSAVSFAAAVFWEP
ncbi:AmmeMemoRadiSam system protein B [bacterium]|nr:AmmeMemoRadiSam system protein B [candidate division CSSED10-310 bacterium]